MRTIEILKRARNGERLVKAFLCKQSGAVEITYHLDPSGLRVKRTTAEGLIANGELKAVGDGLFACSQTWLADPDREPTPPAQT